MPQYFGLWYFVPASEIKSELKNNVHCNCTYWSWHCCEQQDSVLLIKDFPQKSDIIYQDKISNAETFSNWIL